MKRSQAHGINTAVDLQLQPVKSTDDLQLTPCNLKAAGCRVQGTDWSSKQAR